MTEEQKKFNFTILWKLGFMLLLGILIGIWFCKTALALNWFLNKTSTCDFVLGNYSFEACDNLWCNVIECEYDINLMACICNFNNDTDYNISQIYNKTQVYNKTEIYNSTETYNKTEIENLINATFNSTNMTYSLDLGDNANFTEYRNKVDERIKRLEEGEIGSVSAKSGNSNLALILGIIGGIIFFAILGLVAYFGIMRNYRALAQENKIKTEEQTEDKIEEFINKE